MKYLLQSSFIGFAALCAAQFQDLPDCAKPCAASLPSQCHLDVSCICSDSDWISGISCCIKNKCPPSDQQKTLDVAVQLCDTVNVKLPSAASCPASASATAPASSAIAGGNTVAGETSATSSVSTTASAVSGAEGTSSSSTSGASTTGTALATGSTTASTLSSATQASGAAHVLGSNMGAVGAAVAALALM